jgi:hypothetical protein
MGLVKRNRESAAVVEASLDDVARGLADGTLSRGRALRLMGSALVGAALRPTCQRSRRTNCARPSRTKSRLEERHRRRAVTHR